MDQLKGSKPAILRQMSPEPSDSIKCSVDLPKDEQGRLVSSREALKPAGNELKSSERAIDDADKDSHRQKSSRRYEQGQGRAEKHFRNSQGHIQTCDEERFRDEGRIGYLW
jgi:hypothetical protein